MVSIFYDGQKFFLQELDVTITGNERNNFNPKVRRNTTRIFNFV